MMAEEQQETLRFVRENTTQTSQPTCLDNNGGMEAGQMILLLLCYVGTYHYKN